MNLRSFLLTLLLGALAGWIAGLITKGKGFGVAGNIVVGIVGAFLGTFCLGLIGLAATNLIGQMLVAVLGALLFLWLLRFIKR